MRVGIMVTNHGSHSPEKWAAESAAQIVDIIQIEPTSVAYHSLTIEKTKVMNEIEQVLVKHHDAVQKRELNKLEEHGTDRFDHEIAPNVELHEAAVADVLKATEMTMFAEHFRKPEVVKFVRSSLGSHFASVKHVERSWYADRNSKN
jgi:hypothetical protein